jgi:kynurenine formamidase
MTERHIGKRMSTIAVAVAISALAAPWTGAGQTREKGDWWPSPHGAQDQAGNTNYITPIKVAKAAQLVKTGRIYEIGQVYEASMPAYGTRPYYINVVPAPGNPREGAGSVHEDYFNGFIGQMGTQFDAFGHMGRSVKMADGTVKFVYYNGYTEEELTGRNRGLQGLESLGVETLKPIVTRGVLIDIAAAKGVPSLEAAYEVTMADVRAALARQKINEDSIEPGDGIVFNYGWAVNWTNPSKYNDGRVGTGDNKGSPGIGIEVARWLSGKKVAMVGADTCCVMVMPASTVNPGNVHHELLLNGVVILENMNLLELAREQGYEFMLVAPPLRIKGATGSPGRPLAIR